MATYWCNNVTGDDTTGDGSELLPWKSIKGSVNKIAVLLDPVGHVLKVVNAGTVYSGVNNYGITIGAAFAGDDYDVRPGLIIEGYPNTSWPILQLNIPSGNNGFDIGASADYVSIRNLRITVGNATNQNPVPFKIEETAKHVRIECIDAGTLPNYAGDCIVASGVGTITLDLEVQCCYCRQSQGIITGDKRFVQLHQCNTASIKHCVTRESEAPLYFTSGAAIGTIDIENCTLMNFKHGVSIGNFGGTSTFTVKNNIFFSGTYVYYCGIAMGGTLTSHNNCFSGLTQLCNHATCATCDNVGLGAGDLWDTNPEFVGGPAWEWLYGLILPSNYEPQKTSVLWGSDQGKCMGACKPFEEEDCICTKGVPPPPCDPCDVVSCGYDSFAGAYPDDWQRLLAKGVVPAAVIVICYDPGGRDLQLTPFVESMRPIKQARDIKFAEYTGYDTDVIFADPTGRFDPHIAGGDIYQDNWFGKFVDVGVWLVGTSAVLKLGRYFLVDALPIAGGKTRWRLEDIFVWLLRSETRANSLGKFSVTSSASGTVTENQASCDPAFCRQQVWTVTFTTATDFTIEGAKIGLDGGGSTGLDFTSTSGSIYLPTTFWNGVWAIGDKVTFTSGVRYTATNVIAAARNMLTVLSDIPEAWLDKVAWDDIEAKSTAYKITYWSDNIDDPLRLLRIFMRHRMATAFPTHEAKISVMTFEPEPSQWVTRCIGKRYNLVDLEAEHLPVYNVLSAQTGYGEGGSPSSGAQYPAAGDANPSWARYNMKYPYTFTLRGYVSADYSTVRGLLQEFYFTRAGLPYNPRQVFKLTSKMTEANMYLGEVVYIDSGRPVRQGYGLVVEISKDISGRAIKGKLMDVSDVIEPPSGCGYGFCGGVGTTDDCWVYGA